MSIKGSSFSLKIFFLILLSTLLCKAPQAAEAFWFNGGEPLLKINDVAYTSVDFRNWWQEWREPESPLPTSLTPFVEWMILVQEARNMELEENRAYRRKIDIFVKSRSLMMFKHEMVDSQIKEPDKEFLWGEYEKKYQPIFELKILQLADQVVAEKILKACVDGTELEQAALDSGVAEPRFLLRKGVRPASAGEVFKPLFEDQLDKGRFLLLLSANGFWMVVEVVDKQVASDEDFAGKVEGLRKDYFRDQERRLNISLIVLYFSFLLSLATFDFFAIFVPFSRSS